MKRTKERRDWRRSSLSTRERHRSNIAISGRIWSKFLFSQSRAPSKFRRAYIADAKGWGWGERTSEREIERERERERREGPLWDEGKFVGQRGVIDRTEIARQKKREIGRKREESVSQRDCKLECWCREGAVMRQLIQKHTRWPNGKRNASMFVGRRGLRRTNWEGMGGLGGALTAQIVSGHSELPTRDYCFPLEVFSMFSSRRRRTTSNPLSLLSLFQLTYSQPFLFDRFGSDRVIEYDAARVLFYWFLDSSDVPFSRWKTWASLVQSGLVDSRSPTACP